MRVAFVSHTAAPSGAELAMMEVVRRAPQGVTPVLMFGATGRLYDQAMDDGFEVHLYWSANAPLRRAAGLHLVNQLSCSLKSMKSARACLRDADVDVVVCNNLRTGLVVGMAARSLSLPVIWHVRDRLTREYLGFVLWLLSHLASRLIPNGLIVNSETTKDTLRLAKAMPVIVVYSPIDWCSRSRRPTDACWTAAHVGRISPWKGQHVFLRAFASAFPSGAERALIVGAPLFGEEAYLQELKTLVKNLGIEPRVSFLGHRDDVPRILAEEVDVMVHSSTLPEPFGQVVAQGLATGLPVIASAAGGPTEIIHHEENGLLIAPGDVSALKTALQRLRRDGRYADMLASAAHDSAAGLRDSESASARVFAFAATFGGEQRRQHRWTMVPRRGQPGQKDR